ncbi:MAG: zinc-binding dehydrogenase [Acidobacteriota bacterium]
MRAVIFRDHGGVDRLEFTEVSDPKIKANEVLVEVRACALNHLDIWTRTGLPGLKAEMPHILGSDIAGVVCEVGELVRHIKPGQAVMLQPGVSCGHCNACLAGNDNLCLEYDILGHRRQGGYAELVAVPAENVIAKPTNLDFNQAAAVPLVFLTAWHMLVGRVNLRAGEDLLVLAAGSGVGSAAIQLGKLLGARVIATASTDEKLARARELGADDVINYEKEDFAVAVRTLTSKKGVEVVFEHTGSQTWPKSVAALARGGRLVTCGATSGYEAITDLRALFAKHLTFYGSFMGSKAELLQVLKFFEQGRLRPVVDQVMPLNDARAAHERMMERHQFGKIVLNP